MDNAATQLAPSEDEHVSDDLDDEINHDAPGKDDYGADIEHGVPPVCGAE